MAKPVVVSHQGVVSSFQLSKLERQKLYGARRRIPVDGNGEPCTRAALTDDGMVLIKAGMTAQGWFDPDGHQVESREIGARDGDGNPLEPVPTTLGEVQQLEGPVPATEVLDLALEAVYSLEPESLDEGLAAALQEGAIWRFRFNYRPDYRAETAYLLANDEGLFALVGVPAGPRFLEPNAPPPQDDDDESDDDLDFEML
jgi:hypothetical protein